MGFSEEHHPVVFFTNVGKITGCCLPAALRFAMRFFINFRKKDGVTLACRKVYDLLPVSVPIPAFEDAKNQLEF